MVFLQQAMNLSVFATKELQIALSPELKSVHRLRPHSNGACFSTTNRSPVTGCTKERERACNISLSAGTP